MGLEHDHNGASRLQQLLEEQLGMNADLFYRLWHDCKDWERLTARSELLEVEANLARLLDFYSRADAVKLLTNQPVILASPSVVAWFDFLEEYGLSQRQIQDVVSTCPELLVKGSLTTAGAAILRLKELRFDNDEVRHRVIAYCPGVLMMEAPDIDLLIRLWAKFKTGPDGHSGM